MLKWDRQIIGRTVGSVDAKVELARELIIVIQWVIKWNWQTVIRSVEDVRIPVTQRPFSD